MTKKPKTFVSTQKFIVWVLRHFFPENVIIASLFVHSNSNLYIDSEGNFQVVKSKKGFDCDCFIASHGYYSAKMTIHYVAVPRDEDCYRIHCDVCGPTTQRGWYWFNNKPIDREEIEKASLKFVFYAYRRDKPWHEIKLNRLNQIFMWDCTAKTFAQIQLA